MKKRLQLLQSVCKEQLLVNQLQFGLMHAGLVQQGVEMNTTFTGSVHRDLGILDYCQLNGITIQAWSPLQYGFMEGSFIDQDKFPKLNEKLNDLALRHGVTKAAIAIAWILRHPAKMQVLVGTMNLQHLQQITKAANVTLTKQEWYELYQAAGYQLP